MESKKKRITLAEALEKIEEEANLFARADGDEKAVLWLWEYLFGPGEIVIKDGDYFLEYLPEECGEEDEDQEDGEQETTGAPRTLR